MGIFSSLFGGREPEGREYTQSTGISYDPQLVDKLKEDHRDLVKIFSSIKSSAIKGDFREIPQILSDFKLALQTHLAVENVRFYVYVQQAYAHDVDTSDFITGLRSEMNGIARAVIKFTDKYSAVHPTHATLSDFLADLDGIGSALVKRVELEETRLYSLYHAT
jgi:regulator of sigma D